MLEEIMEWEIGWQKWTSDKVSHWTWFGTKELYGWIFNFHYFNEGMARVLRYPEMNLLVDNYSDTWWWNSICYEILPFDITMKQSHKLSLAVMRSSSSSNNIYVKNARNVYLPVVGPRWNLVHSNTKYLTCWASIDVTCGLVQHSFPYSKLCPQHGV